MSEHPIDWDAHVSDVVTCRSGVLMLCDSQSNGILTVRQNSSAYVAAGDVMSVVRAMARGQASRSRRNDRGLRIAPQQSGSRVVPPTALDVASIDRLEIRFFLRLCRCRARRGGVARECRSQMFALCCGAVRPMGVGCPPSSGAASRGAVAGLAWSRPASKQARRREAQSAHRRCPRSRAAGHRVGLRAAAKICSPQREAPGSRSATGRIGR